MFSTQALIGALHKTRDTDEFERLAKKFCSEHAGKVGNAWLVLCYAGAVRRMVCGKHGETNATRLNTPHWLLWRRPRWLVL